MKKTTWVFLYIKHSKFWNVSLEHFVEHKPLIYEECFCCYLRGNARGSAFWEEITRLGDSLDFSKERTRFKNRSRITKIYLLKVFWSYNHINTACTKYKVWSEKNLHYCEYYTARFVYFYLKFRGIITPWQNNK